MTTTKPVVVVIPIHREEPSDIEKIGLCQALKVFKNYPIVFQTSRGLNTAWYKKFCQDKVPVEFRESPFNSFSEYNTVLHDPAFFASFNDYEYMMVCHMDAFPFRDELPQWCSSGYDVIGGVVYERGWEENVKLTTRLFGLRTPPYYFNGGFILYKNTVMTNVLSNLPFSVKMFKEFHRLRRNGVYPLNDIMLAQIQHKFKDFLKIPEKHVAARFGANLMDDYDLKLLSFTNKDLSSLPFGAHGWFRWQKDFWKPCIESYGYQL